MSRQQQAVTSLGTDSLADILDRVLDKGLVIAGDIKINLGDVELLTIRIRLLVCSVDKAQELGIAWWHGDPFYSGQRDASREAPADVPVPAGAMPAAGVRRDEELARLRARIAALESTPCGQAAREVT